MEFKLPIKLDKEALEQMGLKSEAIWLFEYDIPSAIKNQHGKNVKERISQKFSLEQAKKLVKLKNWLSFQLKFKLHATRNLYSSWFISQNNLELAETVAKKLRSELEAIGLHEYANKVRIIPIFTTEEGYESFMDRKAEFLLEFIGEATEKVEKGIKDGFMSESALWRCKKTLEVAEAIKEELKDHERYNELVDSIAILDDLINQYEALKAEQKQKEAKN